MSIRTEQLASSLKRSISEILARGLADPRLQGLISVTEVRLSPDLSEARVGISVAADKYKKRAIEALQQGRGTIRSRVGRSIALRRMPRLEFVLDRSMKKQAEVMAAINEAVSRSGPPPADASDDAPAVASTDRPHDPEPPGRRSASARPPGDATTTDPSRPEDEQTTDGDEPGPPHEEPTT